MFTEYLLIQNHYGDRTARRSGVRLMNHIDEGLRVMDAIQASDMAQRAFCLHPLLQTDEDLRSNYAMVCNEARPAAILLAMEYRARANDWLSDKVFVTGSEDGHFGPCYHKRGMPNPGPLMPVKEMLIADKVQNYKDFLQYHHGKHERSAELNIYFETWLEVLDVSKGDFKRLCAIMNPT